MIEARQMLQNPPPGQSGLEYLKSVIGDPAKQAPMSQTLGFDLVEAEEGRVTFAGIAHKALYNPFGVVQGGWFGVLLDSAMSCSVFAALPAGRGPTSIEYKINILRPATEASGLLRAEAEALRVGRRVGYAEGRVVDAEGRVYATGSSNCLIIDVD